MGYQGKPKRSAAGLVVRTAETLRAVACNLAGPRSKKAAWWVVGDKFKSPPKEEEKDPGKIVQYLHFLHMVTKTLVYDFGCSLVAVMVDLPIYSKAKCPRWC